MQIGMTGANSPHNKDLDDELNTEELFSSEQFLANAGYSVFRLTRMAMLRALEINSGSRPLVDFNASEKPTTIALREIVQGKITFKKSVLVEGHDIVH